MRNAKKKQVEDGLREIKQDIDLVINPMAKERQALRNSVLREKQSSAESQRSSSSSSAAAASSSSSSSSDMTEL